MFCDEAYANSPDDLAHWQRLRRGEPVSGRFERRAASDEPVWLEASYNPVFDESGRPRKFIELAADVSPASRRSRKRSPTPPRSNAPATTPTWPSRGCPACTRRLPRASTSRARPARSSTASTTAHRGRQRGGEPLGPAAGLSSKGRRGRARPPQLPKVPGRPVPQA
ncbi:PAS domain-containing protein [Thauera phenylacetica]|uniref:PAS domain-containing protein n=1 Tax=Thauera phenylacetica TaxID=164400 RepID=UPI001FE07959|nr:PAS domain-containing protein [Thauera phenylacetica]